MVFHSTGDRAQAADPDEKAGRMPPLGLCLLARQQRQIDRRLRGDRRNLASGWLRSDWLRAYEKGS